MVVEGKAKAGGGSPSTEGATAEIHNFWRDKTPCWEMSHCPVTIRSECPAFKCQHLPCWQIEGTFRKVYDYEQGGDGTNICRRCEVYAKRGAGEPIEIRLSIKDMPREGIPEPE
jgi:hypothetical protein